MGFARGQTLELVRVVSDDETGYSFPIGSTARFEEPLKEGFCLIALDASVGDSFDTGELFVMVRLDDLQAV